MSEGKKFSALIEPSFFVLAFLCLIVALSRTSVRFNGIVRNFLLFAVACVEFCAWYVRGGHSSGRSLVTACRYCCLEGESSSLTDTRSQYYPGDYRCYRAVCRRQGQRSAFVETMCSDLGALAQFCTLYSMTGMAFCVSLAKKTAFLHVVILVPVFFSVASLCASSCVAGAVMNDRISSFNHLVNFTIYIGSMKDTRQHEHSRTQFFIQSRTKISNLGLCNLFLVNRCYP